MTHIVIVGGGIAGLTAAYRLRQRYPAAAITVIERDHQLGGKLRTGARAGVPLERGAETFLARDPAAAALAAGLGLPLAHPAGLGAAVAVGGILRPMPGGTLMGVPGDPAALAASGWVHVRPETPAGHPLLAAGEDVAVGRLVRSRIGDEVVDRLVDPLLGGVYAGRADDLSLAVTLPALAAAAREHDTLTGAVRAVQAAAPKVSGPVFATVVGGLSALVAAVAAGAKADVRLGLPVRALTRTPTDWRLVVGSTRDAHEIAADAVVLAVPARPASRLLAGVSEAAAGEVGRLDYASVALVSLAVPAVELPPLSGFLVPATEGYAVKAATFFDRKWTHVNAPGLTLLRASLGRYGDEHVLQRTDAELVDLVAGELGTLLGRPLGEPVDSHVQRWGGALPQYAPGHLDRVRRARAALADTPTLALAGAAYDGIGIPACIRSGGAAAERLAAALPEEAR